jgi:hypothetical protein
MPELVDDLAELPSLSDLLIAERDEERDRRGGAGQGTRVA